MERLLQFSRTHLGVMTIAVLWLLVALLFPTRAADRNGTHLTTDVATGFGGSAGRPQATGPGSTGLSSSSGSPVVGAPVAGASLADAGADPGRSGTTAGAGAAPTAEEQALAAEGRTRSGEVCAPGVKQVPNASYSPQCQPVFVGDNGGATFRGVTADKIVIVRRRFAQNQATGMTGFAEQTGFANQEAQTAASREFVRYFSETFELYGRSVELIEHQSRYGNQIQEASGGGRENACLDAQDIFDRYQPFGIVTGVSTGPAFSECAAALGMVVFDASAYTSEERYDTNDPYLWHLTMDCSRSARHIAEYLGKRLAGRIAIRAKDALLQSSERKFGLHVPDRDDFQTCAELGLGILEQDYGVQITSRYDYAPDLSRLADEANRAMVQFRAAGVTSVILMCEPISVLFLTQAATNQNYYPEFIMTGIAAQDLDNFARLYDQQAADGSMFGMSQLGSSKDITGPDSESATIYRQATGEDIDEGVQGGYGTVVAMFDLLQAAGPYLTPDAVAAGSTSLIDLGAPRYAMGRWSWNGDHTGIEDHREVYWDRSATSGDGGTGSFVGTYGNQRFDLGQWPAEEPPVYP